MFVVIKHGHHFFSRQTPANYAKPHHRDKIQAIPLARRPSRRGAPAVGQGHPSHLHGLFALLAFLRGSRRAACQRRNGYRQQSGKRGLPFGALRRTHRHVRRLGTIPQGAHAQDSHCGQKRRRRAMCRHPLRSLPAGDVRISGRGRRKHRDNTLQRRRHRAGVRRHRHPAATAFLFLIGNQKLQITHY